MDDQPAPITIKAECGNCAAWSHVAAQGLVEIGTARRGICRGLPPIPFARLTPSGKVQGQIDLRPCPPENETCLLFTPRADLITGPGAPH